MTNNMNFMIYLASGSASRKQLLETAGLPHTVISQSADEDAIQVRTPYEDYVETLSICKMTAIESPKKLHENSIILTADTVIVGVETNELFGKPRDREHAREMIKKFQQQEMFVITGMSFKIIKNGEYIGSHTSSSKTRAKFIVPDEYIDIYLDSSPFTMKACAATVIEGMGAMFMQHMNGSLSSAMGIDLHELFKVLRRYDCM